MNSKKKAKTSKKNLSNPGRPVLDVVFIMFQVIAISPYPSSTLMQKHACWKCH